MAICRIGASSRKKIRANLFSSFGSVRFGSVRFGIQHGCFDSLKVLNLLNGSAIEIIIGDESSCRHHRQYDRLRNSLPLGIRLLLFIIGSGGL